ncbi:TauD/TfdA family dioxygenase (plasmid) [Sphingobium sp. SJ10-10]|uniref:TauD/TfdA dioxygenase family protein n=1 Tax=Sphingobium sp. SJ10-10 TaxID=3114999 RepID=UPI002E190FB0|nr:TauD/TfdA family dioxygenase [Sphingobium sp. SJ10-10]
MSSAAADILDRADGIIGIRPLQPTIGAEIDGVDLSKPLAPEQRDAIRAALLRYKVIFFRDQPLTNDQHAAFAGAFGPLYTHPSNTADPKIAPIHKIAAVDAAKYEKRIHRYVKPGDGYHSDTSWRLVPTWGAVLRAVTLPEVGGDTIWVDAHLAYEGLSDDVKARLEGLHVTHDFREALTGAGHDYPIVAHPVVRTHRETGQKILWVNYTQRPQILGVELAESRELLEEIIRQYKRPEYQVRFSWRPNSVAFWDNRAAVHYAVRNYGDFPRVLERILIADEPLYANL